MIRRSPVAAIALLLLLVGPLGLLELDHDELHAHATDASNHPECPVCFAAKVPVVLDPPSDPVILEAPAAPLADAPRPVGRESLDLVRSFPPRGPPAVS